MFGRKKWKLTDFVIEDGVAIEMTEKAGRRMELTNVLVIPEGITEFDVYLGGEPIRALYLPKSLRRIGERVFEDCFIESIFGGDNVREIEKQAFKNNQLTTVLGFKNLEIIGEEAFCQNRISKFFFNKRLKEIERGAFKSNRLESVDLQALRRVNISDYAFYDNILEDIKMPEISKVNRTSFSFNPVRKMLKRKAEKDSNWTEDDFYRCGYELTGISRSGIEKINRTRSMTIPTIPGITCISFEKAIYDQLPDELEYVYICDGIEQINENVFDKSNIKHIRFPKTLKKIMDSSFQNSAIVSVDLSETQLTKIGAYVFSGCDSLNEIKLPKTLVSIGYASFQGVKSLKEIRLFDRVESIHDEAFSDSGIKRIIFGNNSKLKYIGMRAFENSSIQEFDFSKLKNLEEISMYAFAGTGIKKPRKIAKGADVDDTAFEVSSRHTNYRKRGLITSILVNLFS